MGLSCIKAKTMEYPRNVTLIVLNGEQCNAQYGRSIQVGITADRRSPKRAVNSKNWAEPPRWGRVSFRKDFHHWLWLQPIVTDLHFKIKLYKLNIVSRSSKIK